ncbi:MAG: response regulator [Alphaproteobacteria bacterium]|nr:response regulator [Alphaproteobacteria bacterium]
MARAETSERTVLLMADDDPADCLLTEKALRRADITCPLYVVHDGAELLDYLKRRGDYADPEAAPRPSLILLDLNMPKVNGTEVLEQLRDEPELCRIPVLVLTTSDEERDIASSYALGANAYMVKPSAFDEMVSVAEIVKAHWLETVRLPP